MKINDFKTAKKPRVKEAIDPALSFEHDDPEFAAKKRGMGYFDYSTLKREDFNDDDWYVWDPEQQQFVASYGARSSTALDFRMRESFSGTYKMPDGRIAMRGMRAKFMPGVESRNNDNLDEAAKTLQMIESWEEFKETVPALKEVRRRQANSSVREATGDPKFDKMLKGITGKRQVAKQQKADTKQQARDAFGGMFGGGNPADKLSIRKKGGMPTGTVPKPQKDKDVKEQTGNVPQGWEAKTQADGSTRISKQGSMSSADYKQNMADYKAKNWTPEKMADYSQRMASGQGYTDAERSANYQQQQKSLGQYADKPLDEQGVAEGHDDDGYGYKSLSTEQIMKLIQSGNWEAVQDIVPGKHVQLRNNRNGKNTTVHVKRDMAEGKKKRKKKSSRALSRYFFPGYGYYGGGESGEGGGEGGGESIDPRIAEGSDLDENLRDWFKDKWVRFGPDGKIRGDCARGSESEGKPKCLPQAKAHALGKKGRASAAARKRREDPNANRTGAAINVATKKKTNEVQLDEKCWDTYKQVGMKKKGSRMVPNCVPKESQEQSQQCPECGGSMYPETMLNEKKDACYYKVKASAKVWPSAYASGRLVQCRKRGASNYGKKSESVAEDTLDEKWSKKYKSSIDCSNPKGFSQRAHCAGRKNVEEAANAAQQAAIAINMKKHHKKPKGVAEGKKPTHIDEAEDLSMYEPRIQELVRTGQIHPSDAAWMNDYHKTPGNSRVETGKGAFKDQSEKMQNFVNRMRSGEIPVHPQFKDTYELRGTAARGGGGSGGVSDTRELQLGADLDPKSMMKREGYYVKQDIDVTEDNAALKTIRGPHGKLDVDRSEKGVTKVKRQHWRSSYPQTGNPSSGIGVPQSTKFSSVDTERNANRRRLRLDRDEVSEESDISNDELFGPRAVTGTLLDRQALNVANKLTTDKNLAKLNDMAHDSTIYRALERYFVKNNISTTIFNRVAAIVFKKLDKYGRRLSTDPRIQEQGVAEGTDDIAQAKERLSYLEKIFDTSYEYSDDHSVWKKNHAIEQEIRKLKKIIGQDGIAEAEDNKDAAAAKKPGFIDNVKQGAEDYKDLWMMGATGRTPERWKTSAEKAAERGSAPGPQFPLKEGRMKEIAIEFQDYKHLPDMAFQSRYKISKRDWWNKHAKLVQGSGLGIGMDEARGKIKAKVVHPRPTRAEREHDRIRKERGLPNPSHYKTLGDKLDKEIAALRGDDTDQ